MITLQFVCEHYTYLKAAQILLSSRREFVGVYRGVQVSRRVKEDIRGLGTGTAGGCDLHIVGVRKKF